tara:strand:- start:294 stop:1085 length:792 start_codon:yes stop_codon:yes gene_type:complete
MILYLIILLIILFIYFKNKHTEHYGNKKRIYIINLDRDKERLSKLKKNGNMFNINRIKAVEGSKLDTDIMKKDGILKMDNESFRYSKDGIKDTFKGSIGCSLSHINLWKKLKNENKNKNDQYFIIFEDDSILNSNSHIQIERCLNNIKQLDIDWDIIFLGGSRVYGERVGEFIRAKYVNSWMNCGLFAYIINKNSIDKLISKALPINTYIDMQINKYYGTDINAFYTYPSIIKHNYDFGSSRDKHLTKYDNKFIEDAEKVFII